MQSNQANFNFKCRRQACFSSPPLCSYDGLTTVELVRFPGKDSTNAGLSSLLIQGCHNCQSSLFNGLTKLLLLFQVYIHSSPKLRPLTLIPAMKIHMQSASLLLEYLAGSKVIGSSSPERAVVFMNVHTHIHTHSSV